MTSAGFASFNALALAARQAVFGQTVKIDTVEKTACFTAPRMQLEMGDSTLDVPRYTSTLRIPAASIPGYVEPSDLEAMVVQLPDGAGWRTYEVLPGAQYVAAGLEWRIELRSL